MDQLVEFNGVKVLLTTGQTLNEVQSFLDEADVVISVYSHELRVIRHKYHGAIVCGSGLTNA